MGLLNRVSATLDSVKGILSPPSLSDDDEKAHLLAVMSWIVLIIVPVFSVLWMLIVPHLVARLGFFVPFGLIMGGTALILTRLRRLRLAGLVLVGGGWVLVTVVTITSGSARAPFYGVYALIVMVAALLFGWRVAFLVAILETLAGLVMAYLDHLGVVPAPLATPLSAWLTQTGILWLMWVNGYFAAHRSDQALERVRYELIERKKAEQALQESEARFKALVANSSDIITVLQSDGTIVFSSSSSQRLLGYAPGELSAHRVFDYIHPDDVAHVAAVFANMIQAPGATATVEFRFRHANGSWITLEARGTNLLHDPIIQGAVVNSRDVTDRMKAEGLLAQEHILLRTVIDCLPDNIFVKDRNSRFVLNNAGSLAVLGVSQQEEAIGKSDFDFFPPELAEAWRAQEQAIMQSGQGVVEVEEFQPWRANKRRWVIGSTIPLRDERGVVFGVLGVSRDITERKLVEQALRDSETRYRVISELISDYAFSYDVSPDGSLIPNWITDDSFTRLTGYRWQDIGATFKLYHPADAALAQHDVQETIRGQTTSGEYRIMTRSGQQRWLRIHRHPVWSEQEQRVIRIYGAAQDITDRKQTEEDIRTLNTELEQIVEERTAQLRRAKDQIEIILNNTSDAVALSRLNGDIETRNPAFVAMFGPQVSQCIERLLWAVANDDLSLAIGNALVSVIWDHVYQHVETQIISDGGQDKDIDLVFIPVQLADEDVQRGVLVSAHDITHLKEIERFKARFVADALHDLATPISALSTRLHILKRSPENLDDHVRALGNQVEHLRSLLSDLRTLAQVDRAQLSLNLEVCNLNQLSIRVFDTYEPVAIDNNQSLQLITDPALPDMLLDSQQIERVLVNLVTNAVNYTPGGRNIRILTALQENSAIFSVADEGIGISPEELPRIFERFYRTDQARRARSTGTGLGLAIVKEIVELHGGTVVVHSEPGQGSTFSIRLPIREEPVG